MRPCKLKLNEKQKRCIFLIDFFFFFSNGQNLLLQNWKFSNENIFRYVKNPASYHISFQIGMCK